MSRTPVLERYAAAYERMAELEQVSVAQGQYDQAEAAHALALACLRAYTAEQDDPEPRDTCHCVNCNLYRVGVRRVA